MSRTDVTFDHGSFAGHPGDHDHGEHTTPEDCSNDQSVGHGASHRALAQRLVNVTAAARLLSIGGSTVDELIVDGELHLVQINRSARISVAEIDAFVAELKRQALDASSADVRRRPS